MIRKYLKRKINNADKINDFLEKYNLPKIYFIFNRKLVVKGIYIGYFWAFIPMPMQFLGIFLSTLIFRFNVFVALLAILSTNPITYPPIWFLEYKTGLFLLGESGIKNISLSVEWFMNNWDNIVYPLYIGSAFFSIFISALIALIVNFLWKHSVLKERAN